METKHFGQPKWNSSKSFALKTYNGREGCHGVEGRKMVEKVAMF